MGEHWSSVWGREEGGGREGDGSVRGYNMPGTIGLSPPILEQYIVLYRTVLHCTFLNVTVDVFQIK